VASKEIVTRSLLKKKKTLSRVSRLGRHPIPQVATFTPKNIEPVYSQIETNTQEEEFKIDSK